MTTKQYLNQIYRLDRMINNKLSEIYQLKSLACTISVANDGEKVKASINQDKLGDSVAKIVDMEKETDKMIDELLELKKRIIGQIESIEDTNYYNVLFLRYIKRDTFDNISKEMNYSRQQLWRIHNESLQEFESRFGSEYLK